jgi:hypothetical protein
MVILVRIRESPSVQLEVTTLVTVAEPKGNEHSVLTATDRMCVMSSVCTEIRKMRDLIRRQVYISRGLRIRHAI